MEYLSYKNVNLTSGFLAEREAENDSVTLDAVYDRFYETGRVEAFSCKWKPGQPFMPHIFWDSDVAKWIEGASYAIGRGKRSDLTDKVEHIIDMIEASQWDDGYINSHFTVAEPDKRFTGRGLHELYCCGHLIEAAVAYYEATGRDRFLKIMCCYAGLIDRIFRVENSAAFITPGHEEIELALFRLYRCTKDEKYRTLAQYFLEMRGNNDKDNPSVKSQQQDYPIREQTSAVGHAVRAAYLYSAMADYAALSGDMTLKETCEKVFSDITEGKMYITGGTGSCAVGEVFTVPYDLPNEHAYSETCSAIALIFFADRMLSLENKAEYADAVERALYNSVISGVSLDGSSFFYENPLEINLSNRRRAAVFSDSARFPISQRVKVFDCSCCPPNLNRLLASLGGRIFGTEADTVFVNQFTGCKASYNYNGKTVNIEQITDYPCSGKVVIKTSGVKKLYIRIPGWCESFTLNAEYTFENGYAVVECPVNELTVDFDMPVKAVYSDIRIRSNINRAAIMRGPVVYCAEGGDNGKNGLDKLFLSRCPNAEAGTSYGGLPTLTVDGFEALTGKLYGYAEPEYRSKRIKLIPYFTFANRSEDDMQVWMNVR